MRTEHYALDGTADEAKPYTVSEATFEVRQLQDRGINQYGVYLPLDRESLGYHYERVAVLVGEELIEDPRISHSFVLEVDDYGAPLRSASVVYPRRGTPIYAEQAQLYITLSEAEVIHLDGDDDTLRLAVPTESRSYELHGLASGSAAFSWQDLRDAADVASEIAFTANPAGVGTEQKHTATSTPRSTTTTRC